MSVSGAGLTPGLRHEVELVEEGSAGETVAQAGVGVPPELLGAVAELRVEGPGGNSCGNIGLVGDVLIVHLNRILV